MSVPFQTGGISALKPGVEVGIGDLNLIIYLLLPWYGPQDLQAVQCRPGAQLRQQGVWQVDSRQQDWGWAGRGSRSSFLATPLYCTHLTPGVTAGSLVVATRRRRGAERLARGKRWLMLGGITSL